MLRIILPLALAASLIFAPIFKETFESSRGGTVDAPRTATDLYFSATLECAKQGEFNPMTENCKPVQSDGKTTLQSWMFYSAVSSSIIAAGLGVIGLLPVIGRLTSVVTTGAGGISTAAMATFLFDVYSKDGLQAIHYGGWLAGVLALLTLLSGFTGMAGNND